MQNREKQIEEMACDMCVVKHICNEPNKPIASCYALKCAERAYNAGYRKQEWISVEERLPETQEEVLTFSECNGVRSALLLCTRDDINTWFLCKSDKLSISVTHWMPLPEPPKMKGGAE